MSALLFYAGQLVIEISTPMLTGIGFSRYVQEAHGLEIYNGGYLYFPSYNPQWMRCDLTPVLLEDVPKELRLLVLLNN